MGHSSYSFIDMIALKTIRLIIEEKITRLS